MLLSAWSYFCYKKGLKQYVDLSIMLLSASLKIKVIFKIKEFEKL